MIRVQEVTKRFADVVAVQSLSFSAPDGAITGLLGANGAGKTTTLRMIAGVSKPDAGAIAIGDASSRADAVASRKCIGALLDHIGLYPRLTARENLVYFARLRGLRGAELERRVERVLVDLGLRETADRRTGGFSQGQRMKAALGRALIHEPRHLLLDEPTNGLDVPAVRSLRGVLKRYREAGACVILSSHVLGEVEDLCDRIVVLARGSVAGQGTRDELCAITDTDSLEGAFIALTGEAEEA
jgi:sodium transport system ATP-binding protein